MELLIVTDESIYKDHERYANTKNQNLVFLHMRIYFATYSYINNLKYINSLKNDPDLRISFTTVAFLFLTVWFLYQL